MEKKTHQKSFKNFFNSELPLTSKRVRIILSCTEDTEELLKSIRASRLKNVTQNNSFKVTKRTKDRLVNTAC